MNPYETPQVPGKSIARTRRLDVGVLVLASLMLVGCLISFLTFASDTLSDFLKPRFGTLGLMAGMNPLIFIGCWIKTPTRSILFTASFMACFVGVMNGLILFQSGTVDMVENFHDRIHSAWLWSVLPYIIAGSYFALVASRQTQLEQNVG